MKMKMMSVAGDAAMARTMMLTERIDAYYGAAFPPVLLQKR